jgi:hypothetical protein
MTDYNITLELESRDFSDQAVDELHDTFAEYGPTLGRSDGGRVEVTMTLTAPDVIQVAATIRALGALVQAQGSARIHAVQIVPAEEFEARRRATPLPELVSVSEAAATLEISPQAVLKAIKRGALEATNVGKIYVVTAASVAAYKASREGSR